MQHSISSPAIILADGTRLRFVTVPPGHARDIDIAPYLEQLTRLFDSLIRIESRLKAAERGGAAEDFRSAIKALIRVTKVRFQLEPVRERFNTANDRWQAIRLDT